MKRLFLSFTLILYFCNSNGQIAYRTRYKTALFAESFGVSPILSFNVEKSVNRGMKSFTALRAGAGIVPGAFTIEGIKNGGFSFPMSVTQNVNVNNLKRRVKYRVSMRCRATPSKVAVEWFGEFGLTYTPVLYFNAPARHYFFGNIGLRQQIVIDVPPRPKVFFLKIQYTPKYYDNNFSFFLDKNTSSIAGISLGYSIR